MLSSAMHVESVALEYLAAGICFFGPGLTLAHTLSKLPTLMSPKSMLNGCPDHCK